jgi:exonuclease III
MTAVADDRIRLLSYNVRQGRRARQACEWINGRHPDVVFWQELQPDDVTDVETWLGMDAYVAAPRPGSRNDNALFLRPDGPFALKEEYRHSWAPWHAPANIEVRLRGADGELSERTLCLVSKHDCYWSPTLRHIENEWLTTLAKPGWLAAVMGDFNSFRTGTAIDWGTVKDRAFYVNRTHACICCGERHTDDLADRTLLDAGFIEAARWAREHLGQHRAMDPTAGYGPDKAAQAGLTAIDRGYLTAELKEAITGFQVGDRTAYPELERISDHLPLVLDLSRSALHTIMSAPAA